MKKRVLVVEDDPKVADVMHKLLKAAGHDFLIVTSSGSALEMVELDADFTVLLTDLGLPQEGDKPQKVNEFEGFRLAENICAMIPGIRVIFCTGKDIAGVQRMLPAGLGSVSFLQKPFRFQEFQRVLRPKKRAAIVAISDCQKEAEAIQNLKREGYTIHATFEDDPGVLAAEILRRDLVPFYDEILVCV